jgi:hypothetical protein
VAEVVLVIGITYREGGGGEFAQLNEFLRRGCGEEEKEGEAERIENFGGRG